MPSKKLSDLEYLLPKEAMAACPQDHHYHAEGDIWAHTEMVCEALESNVDYQWLSTPWKARLMAAAAFHDSGKTFSSYEFEGRIRSPGHAAKSSYICRSSLYLDGWDPLDREAAVGLVRFHGLPLFVAAYDSPIMAIREASMHARCDVLATLAHADLTGRRCVDRDDGIASLSIFQEAAQADGCWVRPKRFPSPQSRFRYFVEQREIYEAYDDTKFKVTLMSGLPGSGKGAWLRDNFDGPVVSLDSIREAMGVGPEKNQGKVVTAAKEMARQYMRKKENFAWDATNVTFEMRTKMVRLFRQYNGWVRIVYTEEPYAELLLRNRNRKNPVPQSVIDKLVKRMSVPSQTEAHETYLMLGGSQCGPFSCLDTPIHSSGSQPGK